MKHPFRSNILPFFTMGAAGLGFVLRLWLFSAIDEKGLLPANHPAGVLLFLLSAIVLGILFLATRKLRPGSISKLPRGCHMAAGLMGCIGLVLNTFLDAASKVSGLPVVTMILSIAGGLALVAMGLLEFRRKKRPYWLSAIVTACLMVQTVAQCQVWGAEPQLQVYFFPLMASIFLILAVYHKTVFLARKSNRSNLAFFSQAAAFFCCLSFNSEHSVFYMGMFLWALLQISLCLPRKKEG